MEDRLYSRTISFKRTLANDPRVVKLEEIEKRMEKDEDVIRLAHQKDLCERDFEDALKHFGEGSKEAKEAQKKLYAAKTDLDKNDLAAEYLRSYGEVRSIYQLINEALFHDFDEHLCEGKR